MTASSSNDDLADLLGNLADAKPGIDEETLDAIDEASNRKSNIESDNETDETTADADGDGDGNEDVAEALPVDEGDDATEDETEADATAAAEEAAHEAEVQEGADALAAVADGEEPPEESEEMEQFAAAAAPVGRAGTGVATGKRRSGRLATAAKGDAMKGTMAPILLTVGLIVLIPAIWGTMLLLGVETFGSDRSNAKTMATFMLLCWPISIALIVTSIILFMQISKAKKKAAAREAR